MTTEFPPALHALTAEPSIARPGEVVRLRFRTRNLGSTPSPAGTVCFRLDPRFEPIGELRLEVQPAAPGDDVVAEASVRVLAACDDGTRLHAQAVLRLPDAELGTNVCEVVVRGRAVLDGPASGTFVEALDAKTVRVRAVVRNEGDAVARDAVVTLPPPPGCARLPGDAGDDQAAEQRVPQLAPGESVELAFDALVVARVAGEVRANDAWVRLCDEPPRALGVRAGAITQPLLGAAVRVRAARLRATVSVDVRNDGWSDARDVEVSLVLPPGVRVLRDAASVNDVPVSDVSAGETTPRRRSRRGPAAPACAGAADAGIRYARLRVDDDTASVSIACVPARACSTVCVDLAYGADSPASTIVARVRRDAGKHELAGDAEHDATHAEASFTPVLARELRVLAVDAPDRTEPGARIDLSALVLNAGDGAERVHVAVEPLVDLRAAEDHGGGSDAAATDAAPEIGTGAAGAFGTSLARVAGSEGEDVLPAGCVRAIAASALTPVHARDGDLVRFRVAARRAPALEEDAFRRHPADAPERCEAVVAVRVCDRASLVLDGDPTGADGAIVYGVRNAGHAAARAIVATFGDERRELRALERGARWELSVSESEARRGGRIVAENASPLALPASAPRSPEAAAVTLRVPDEAVAGGAFGVRTIVEARAADDELAVTLDAGDALSIVPGTTRVDGCSLLDLDGVSPLESGLTLRGVPAGARIVVECSVSSSSTSAEQHAAIVAHVRSASGESEARGSVALVHRAAFALRPPTLAYHVEGCSVIASVAPPAVSELPAAAAAVYAAPRDAADPRCAADEPHNEPEAAADEPQTDVAPALPVRLAFDPGRETERRALLARLLRFPATRLADHVLALRGMLPDAATSGDAEIAAALERLGAAAADSFDRLFVKLRVPGLDVEAVDLEDVEMRGALTGVFETLERRAASGASVAPFGASRARYVLQTLADAPLGDAAALRAALALVPAPPAGGGRTGADGGSTDAAGGDDRVGAALAGYAGALDGALARYDGAPRSSFDDGLGRRAGDRLDDARAELLAALRAMQIAPC